MREPMLYYSDGRLIMPCGITVTSAEELSTHRTECDCSVPDSAVSS